MHPNLSDELNAKITQSEKNGGLKLKDVKDGQVFTVKTKNTLYTIKKTGEQYLVSGNAKLFPEPKLVGIAGSTFGGNMLKAGFVGIGMYLEFCTAIHDGGKTMTTSEIESIELK